MAINNKATMRIWVQITVGSLNFPRISTQECNFFLHDNFTSRFEGKYQAILEWLYCCTFLPAVNEYLNFSAYSPAFGTVTIFLTSAFVIKCIVISIYSYNLHYLIAKHSKHAFVCLFVICCLSLYIFLLIF